MPLRRMKAMTTSMASADSISDRSWFHRLGFAGGVGEQRRVEQRDERFVELLGSAVGPSAQHRMQHGCRVRRASLADRLRRAHRGGRAERGRPAARPRRARCPRRRSAQLRSVAGGGQRCGRPPPLLVSPSAGAEHCLRSPRAPPSALRSAGPRRARELPPPCSEPTGSRQPTGRRNSRSLLAKDGRRRCRTRPATSQARQSTPQSRRHTSMFTRAYRCIGQVAMAVLPRRRVGTGWRTFSTKLLDDALIGWVGLWPRPNRQRCCEPTGTDLRHHSRRVLGDPQPAPDAAEGHRRMAADACGRTSADLALSARCRGTRSAHR